MVNGGQEIVDGHPDQSRLETIKSFGDCFGGNFRRGKDNKSMVVGVFKGVWEHISQEDQFVQGRGYSPVTLASRLT